MTICGMLLWMLLTSRVALVDLLFCCSHVRYLTWKSFNTRVLSHENTQHRLTHIVNITPHLPPSRTHHTKPAALPMVDSPICTTWQPHNKILMTLPSFRDHFPFQPPQHQPG